MATRKEIVYSIKELMKDHTDDTLLSDRHLLFLFSQHRALLLRQLYSDRSKSFDASAMQTLCLDMVKVDKGECGVETECYIVRSKEKLPNLLSLRGRDGIVSIRPAIVGSKSLEVVSADTVGGCMEDQYATNVVFVDNGYLYLAGPKPASLLIQCLRISAIFDNPEELEGYSDCCGCAEEEKLCVTDDTIYPIPGHIIAPAMDAVLKELMGTHRLTADRDIDGDGAPAKFARRQYRTK